MLNIWMAGFVTGMTAARPELHFAGTDGDGITAWMDKYCADHPLDMLVIAAMDLMIHLKR